MLKLRLARASDVWELLEGRWLKHSQQDGAVGRSHFMQGLVAIVGPGICSWHSGEAVGGC